MSDEYACEQEAEYHARAPSRSGRTPEGHEVTARGDDYSCSCNKFTYTGACHHVEAAKADTTRCRWSEGASGRPPVVRGRQLSCPDCGRGVRLRRR